VLTFYLPLLKYVRPLQLTVIKTEVVVVAVPVVLIGVAVAPDEVAVEDGFVVLPWRWVVERTFSWLSQNRRMSKDYERLCASAEAFIYVAMTRHLVRRLARA
jgi:hypothetical protein